MVEVGRGYLPYVLPDCEAVAANKRRWQDGQEQHAQGWSGAPRRTTIGPATLLLGVQSPLPHTSPFPPLLFDEGDTLDFYTCLTRKFGNGNR